MSSTSRFVTMATGSGKSTLTANLVRGLWLNIKLKPDLFSGELFNIGVGFVDQNGTMHSKFTTDLSRLKCLYDNRIDIDELYFILEMATSIYDRLDFSEASKQSFSPQIVLGEQSYASGESIGLILRDFYNQTVSLRSGAEESRTIKERFSSTTNDGLRTELFDWMRKNHYILANRIIQPNPHFTIQTSDGGNQQKHSVELPLRIPGRSAGSVVSANCKSPQTAELRILHAALNINTALRHLDGEDCGLFILRPGESSQLPNHILNKFDDIIDESIWQLRDAGVHVSVEDSVESLGKDIIEWAA